MTASIYFPCSVSYILIQLKINQIISWHSISWYTLTNEPRIQQQPRKLVHNMLSLV